MTHAEQMIERGNAHDNIRWMKFAGDPKPYPYEEYEYLERQFDVRAEKRMFRTNLKPLKVQ